MLTKGPTPLVRLVVDFVLQLLHNKSTTNQTRYGTWYTVHDYCPAEYRCRHLVNAGEQVSKLRKCRSRRKIGENLQIFDPQNVGIQIASSDLRYKTTSHSDILTKIRRGGVLNLASKIRARYSSSGRQPNFAALNRGRHLYSAERPSRWALAHISSFFFFPRLISAVADWMSTILPHTVWP